MNKENSRSFHLNPRRGPDCQLYLMNFPKAEPPIEVMTYLSMRH